MKKRNRIAFFNILSTILLRGISIFTSPLFSRLLGTSGYGVVSAYNTWINVYAITGTMQTQNTLVNATVEYGEEEQIKYQSSVMFLSLLIFLCSSALVVILIKPVSRLLQLSYPLLFLLLFQSFGSFASSFLNNKFTYEFKADKNMYFTVGISVASLLLSLFFVLRLPQEQRYFGRILGNALVYGVLGVAVCSWILRQGRTFYQPQYWKFCIVLAIPAVFHNLSDLFLAHSDLVMLRQMAGDSAGGIYGLAYNFGSIIFTFFAALNNSWVPFFFDDWKNGRKEAVQEQAKNFLELYTVLSVGFVLLVTEVYHVYAGREFWSGLTVIPIFVGSYYLNFLCTFPVNQEYFHKKTAAVAVITVVSALLNIGLNYVLIQKMGMLGAALATFLSHSFQFTCHFVYARFWIREGEYPFPTFQWVPYTAAFVVASALVYLLPGGWLVRWGLGGAVGLWELWRIKTRKSLL